MRKAEKGLLSEIERMGGLEYEEYELETNIPIVA